MRLLEKPDLNYNQIAYCGITAFILSCCNNMREVSLKLLDKKDLEYNQIYDGATALMWAVHNNMEQIVDKLREKQHIGKIIIEEIPSINHNVSNVLDNNMNKSFFLKNDDFAMKL